LQRGEVLRLTAQLHWLLGDTRRAARWLSEAIATCERLGALPELARAHRDAAGWGIDLGDGRSRDAHLARARELFEVLGLPWADEGEVGSRRAA